MRKLLVIFTLIVAVAGIIYGAKSLFISTYYYPYLEISGPEGIHLYILQKGEKKASQCERLLISETAAMLGNCPLCRIESSGCPSNLESSKQRWLGETPLELPSARMAYGVMVYQSSRQQVALATCQETERLSLTNSTATRIKCFPAGEMRPRLEVEHGIVLHEHEENSKKLELALASAAGLIVLVVTSLFLLHRFATNEPSAMVALTEADSLRPAAVKLSNIIKKIMDILLAVFLLIVLMPILVVVALLIRILEGSPIFYVSHRFISSDNSVNIYKFRTMVRDATSAKYRLNERYMRDGFLDIPLECEVYTSIGRILERTQLVETLQLLNILFDGMSFVGNRPLPKNNIELLKKFLGWQERFDSPAGITGISQIVGKYGLLPHQRLHLERMYSNVYINPNGNIILCDLLIIGYTIRLLLTGSYLDYEKAIALLIRCGADKDLPVYFPQEKKITELNDC